MTFQLFFLIIAPENQAIPQARELVQQTRERMEEKSQQLQLFDLIETIIVYKLPRISREEIQQMLGLTEIDLRQTQFYQDVFSEGRLEGREEGRREESMNLVLRLLHRRFGVLELSINEKIQSLTLEQLEQLAESLLDFTCLEDLETWLSNPT